jgi:hypothetical protein
VEVVNFPEKGYFCPKYRLIRETGLFIELGLKSGEFVGKTRGLGQIAYPQVQGMQGNGGKRKIRGAEVPRIIHRQKLNQPYAHAGTKAAEFNQIGELPHPYAFFGPKGAHRNHCSD